MKSSRCRLVLALSLLGSTIQGCGCARNRQVIVKERRGAPIQVDTRDGVQVRAPFVDVRVPARRPSEPSELDEREVEPD